MSNVEDESSGAKTSAQSRKSGSYRRNHQHQHQLISPITEMAHVFTSCLSLSLRTMAFCRTRKLVELVYQRSRQLIVKQQLREKDHPPQSQPQQQQDQQKQGYEGLLQRMASYRGGYVDTERRYGNVRYSTIMVMTIMTNILASLCINKSLFYLTL